jgi:hypothetical protein
MNSPQFYLFKLLVTISSCAMATKSKYHGVATGDGDGAPAAVPGFAPNGFLCDCGSRMDLQLAHSIQYGDVHVSDDERGAGNHDCHPRTLSALCAGGRPITEPGREGDEETEPRNVLQLNT